MPVVHASPFDVHTEVVATHFPPSHRFEQHSKGFVQLAPAAAALAQTPPVNPAPSVGVEASVDAPISDDSLPQLAEDRAIATPATIAREILTNSMDRSQPSDARQPLPCGPTCRWLLVTRDRHDASVEAGTDDERWRTFITNHVTWASDFYNEARRDRAGAARPANTAHGGEGGRAAGTRGLHYDYQRAA